MHIEILDEPELEFGGTQRHIDPRFGLRASRLGPRRHADRHPARPGRPRDQLDGIRRWIDRCRSPIAAIGDKYPHLFPGFPGCDSNTGLCTTLTIADRNCRELPGRELERASGLPGELAVQAMADVYMNELEALAEGNQADVNVMVTELDAVAAARLVDAPTHGIKSNASAKMQLTFLCFLGRSRGGSAIFRSDGTPVAST